MQGIIIVNEVPRNCRFCQFGSFVHLDHDEFVIPCKSKIIVWKVFKEEQ